MTRTDTLIGVLSVGAVGAWIYAYHLVDADTDCYDGESPFVTPLWVTGAIALLVALLLARVRLRFSIPITVVASAIPLLVMGAAGLSHCAG